MERNPSMIIAALRMLAVALALSACGGANPAPPIAHGSLDLSQTLPAPTPTPYEAYGGRQGWLRKGATPDAEAAIAPYLRAQARVGRLPVSSRPAERAARKPLPVSTDRAALAVSRAAPGGEASGPEAVATRVASTDAARLPATQTESARADGERYAQRQSQRLEGYRGGDAVVISVSTLLIVVLIIVLVLLLT